jgi:hypothetical protein
MVSIFQQHCNISENCGEPIGVLSLLFPTGSCIMNGFGFPIGNYYGGMDPVDLGFAFDSFLGLIELFLLGFDELYMEVNGIGSGLMACTEALDHLVKGDILSWRDAGCP